MYELDAIRLFPDPKPLDYLRLARTQIVRLSIKGLGLHSISEVGFLAAHNGEGAFTIGG